MRAIGASPAYDPGRPWRIAAVALLLAALALTFVAAGSGTVPGDVALGRAMQQPPSALLDAGALVASAIGDEFPVMAIVALLAVGFLAARGRRDLALLLAIAAALRALGPVLKTLINSPRPTLEAVVIVAQADGLGFPSGHAFGAALVFGMIAVIVPQVVANRRLAIALQAMAAAMVILIGWSRVRLGVHWPSDVAGGLLYGFGLVCLLQAGYLTWRSRVRT